MDIGDRLRTGAGVPRWGAFESDSWTANKQVKLWGYLWGDRVGINVGVIDILIQLLLS